MNTLEIIRNGLMQCIEKIEALEKRVVNLANRATTLEGRATTLEGRATTLEGRATKLESKDLIFFKFISKNRDAVLLYNKDGEMCVYEDGIVEPTSVYRDYTLTGIAKKYKCHPYTENVRFVNFDTRNVADMSQTFSECSNLESLDLSDFNTDSITSMRSTFFNCARLTSLDVSNFNTSSVTDVVYMFRYCSSLTSLIGTHTLEEVQAGTVKALKGLKVSIDFRWSKNLERASILALFYGLADLTGQTSQTVTLHSTAKARLTAEDIKIATDKNWKVIGL